MTHPESLDPAIEEEWRRLRSQLDLASGFWLGFAFLTSSGTSRVFEQRVARILRSHARKPAVIEAAVPSDTEEILPTLLSQRSRSDCVWVDCVHAATADWDEAIWRLFLRLNERRDAIRRGLPGGLVFALHPSMKSRVREAAPDLWSVRSLVLEPAAVAPLRPRQEDLASRQRSAPLSASAGWAPTRASAPDLRRQLGQVARLLDDEREEEAVDIANRALALLTPRTDSGDAATALIWASRAAEAAEDDGAATDHAERALDLLPTDDHPLRRELLDRIARLAERRQDLRTALVARRALVALARSAISEVRPTSDTLEQLSTALVDEGDVLRDIGQLDAAATAYATSLEIGRRIRNSEGDTPTTLRDLSVSLERVGDIAYDAGDLNAARTVYTESLQLRRRILDTYGDTPTALRDLS
ncbi:hypothetical protein NE235_36470, partial [Actinoallomurus spadix]